MKTKTTCWMGLLGLLGAAQTTAHAQGWGEIDKLREFVTRDPSMQLLTNAQAIESVGLMKSSLVITPWTSTFWPDVMGSIAAPYNDHSLNPIAWDGVIWNNKSYIEGRDELRHNIMRASQEELDNLSPAEKYDLLMGDTAFTLTHRVIDMINVRGDVDLLANWSGVCHGWSPAALTLDRPKHMFQLMSPLGRMITFYPTDVKGLASFLWGKSLAQNNVKSEGFQCQSGAHNNRYGRLTDPRCFDVNPAFFHMVSVNQIGLNKRGFIMDRSYTAEVQNQPVYAYDFKYFNVTERHAEAGARLSKAKVRYTAGLSDPYRNYRSPRTFALVGVEATILYAKDHYTFVNHDAVDGPDKDKHEEFTIRYDLELDENDEIVGGEWREYDDAGAQTIFEQFSYQHPDLIWLVPPYLKAYSIGDADIGSVNWGGYGVVPQAWRKAAIKAAQYTEDQVIKGKHVKMPTPQPLSHVVDLLISLSNK